MYTMTLHGKLYVSFDPAVSHSGICQHQEELYCFSCHSHCCYSRSGCGGRGRRIRRLRPSSGTYQVHGQHGQHESISWNKQIHIHTHKWKFKIKVTRNVKVRIQDNFAIKDLRQRWGWVVKYFINIHTHAHIQSYIGKTQLLM